MSERLPRGRAGGAQALRPGTAMPHAPKRAPGMILTAYRALAAAAGGAAPLLLAGRLRRGKEIDARRNERLGRPGLMRPDGPLIWFHAASVGETNAVLPLLAAIQAERPDVKVLLTTGTVTSAHLAATRLSSGAQHQFIPLDSPVFVRSFLDHWHPDAAIFAESEIWPNFVLEIGARGIPLALVNGSLSERSFNRWRRWPSVSRSLLGAFRLVLAQNERLAQKFAALGAERVLAVGNLKMDAPPPPVDEAELARLRHAIGDRPVLLAASTHPGEEEIVAAVHARLLAQHPGLLTIVVPRHPARASDIAPQLQAMGIETAQRSKSETPEKSCGVYLADTIGELGLFYALAPVAFIGNSLTARGGHNPMEAVKLGAVVLTGPHHANFADAYEALLQAKACVQVSTQEDFAAAVARLLADEPGRASMQNQARQVIAELGGALQRTLDAIAPMLPPVHEPPERMKARRAS